MKRRSFLKIGLSLIVTNLLLESNLFANTQNNEKIIINLLCYGGADFRYLFAPTIEQEELRNLYFSKQPDICSIEEYEPITIDTLNYELKKNNINALRTSIENKEIAIIPNVWFSDNRDHQHSIARNLLGDNDLYTKSTTTLDGWLGRLSGNLKKNAITISNEWSFAARTNSFVDSETINMKKTRPFGITDSDNVVSRALQRYYNSETSNNEIVQNLVNSEKIIKNFSSEINNRLDSTQQVSTNISDSYLNNQVKSLFDSIDSRDILNSNYFYIDNPGWDFHGYFKNSANIKIPDMFGDGGLLDVITTELKKRNLWEQTTLIISSEFGRQLSQNGIQGKDHGHGNLMFVAGGSINGGIYGEMFPEEEKQLWETVGGEIQGKTIGYEILGKIVENIEIGMGNKLFPSFQTGKIEKDFQLYKV